MTLIKTMNPKLALLALLTSAAVAAHAQIVNGGFEDGLVGWTVEAGVANGTFFSRTFENSRDFIPPTRPDWLPVSGERFGSLWSTDSNGVNATRISQQFFANAGDFITFNWFFDFGDVKEFPDTARAWLEDGNGGLVYEFFSIVPTLDDVEFEDFWVPTNVERFDFVSAGTYVIKFETTDGPGVFESILGVDNVAVVPEPATLVALGTSLFGILARRRR